jgi:DNA mismatch repair protein MSH2
MAAVQPVQQLSLGKSTEAGFIQFYNSLPGKPSTTVRVFDRNEYFTVHGEDASLAARLVFHTSTAVKQLGSGCQQLPSVALSRMNFESFARELLLVRQYRVEVYRNKGKGVWTVAYKASPGNLQQLEEVLFGSGAITHTALTLAVRLASGGKQGGRLVGLAYADLNDHVLGVTEFTDSDQLSELQACLVQLGPKECLLMSSDCHGDSGRLRQLLSRCGLLITDRKRAEFSSKDIVQDLNRLLKLETGSSCVGLPQLDMKVAMESLSAVIRYMELLSDEANFSVYRLQTVDTANYMRLDGSAAKALSLNPEPGQPLSTSLTGLLNQCITPPGKRLLPQWLKQPLLDKKSIEERLDLVEALFSDVYLRMSLQSELRHVPDLHRLSRRLASHKANLQDCVKVYQALQRLPNMVSVLKSHESSHDTIVKEVLMSPLAELQAETQKLVELVTTTIDLDLVRHHEFVIRSSFDPGLQELREEMDEVEKKMQMELRKVAEELGLDANKTIRLDSASHLGHFLRVTKKVKGE